eukprot:CAMPEP_0115451136 /NCGR_PEP_ID=MMETSP0271-20121206/41904_1 /TAXON_ID=71861 /ORGANISM="Scrippsiella trochoidea, Strain CCMP3099" /LENGTH=60 /DNA_ID=CAMNT_0002877385 /DNA_START=474 /DNA_END=656 /DNA_ORIENTATION=+
MSNCGFTHETGQSAPVLVWHELDGDSLVLVVHTVNHAPPELPSAILRWPPSLHQLQLMRA